MDFFSLGYILFVTVCLFLYYRVSKEYQWKILLLGNAFFYLVSGKWNIIFILTTSFSIYLGGIVIDRISDRFKEEKKKLKLNRDEKKALKKKYQKYKRIVLYLLVVFNFGILSYMKYFHIVMGLNKGLVLPLGISFYTFQAVGYIIDVYGDKYPAERNFAKFILFISFFPQLIQGPINRYDKLEPQFSKEHAFDYENFKKAMLLILYGLMKKYAIANMLSDSISRVFDYEHTDASGALIVFGILMYSAQQYADFSGGIDVVLGVARLFDIEMMPNFRQPYFSVSLGDFWRRWHISLGAWMRDYVFYPFALTKTMQNFGKWCGKRFGKHFGRVLPAGIANILVFLIVGIWHGVSLHYVLWGLYNGVVIAVSDLAQPLFDSISARLKINTQSGKMHIFRIVRTFIIVNIGWYFDRIEDFGRCMRYMKKSFTQFEIRAFSEDLNDIILNPDVVKPIYVIGGMCISVIGIVAVFIISVLKEKEKDIYVLLTGRKHIFYEFAALFLLILIFSSFIFTTSTGGFLYANF